MSMKKDIKTNLDFIDWVSFFAFCVPVLAGKRDDNWVVTIGCFCLIY